MPRRVPVHEPDRRTEPPTWAVLLILPQRDLRSSTAAVGIAHITGLTKQYDIIAGRWLFGVAALRGGVDNAVDVQRAVGRKIVRNSLRDEVGLSRSPWTLT